MSIIASGRRPSRGLLAAVSTGAAMALVAATLGAAPASAADKPLPLRKASKLAGETQKSTGSLGLGTAGTSGEAGFDRREFPRSGTVQVMLELDQAPAATAYARDLRRGKRVAGQSSKRQAAAVRAQQQSVESRFSASATRAKVLFRTRALYSGIAVSTDVSRLQELSRIPGVKAVRKLTPKRVDNSTTVPMIGASAAWAGLADTGEGVRVGVIDTGIDYTHADFGGPGTVAAYTAARSAGTTAPTYPDPAKVAGGYDFAGDAYDPGATLPDGSPDPAAVTPRPDPNPLDCNGHGTHVSGTVAGYGVNASDKRTYRGPYTQDMPASQFEIGPGVAPGSVLYGLRVFGCDGSTNLVSQALDWAADPNGDGDLSDRLDVVNMSLGSSFGSPQDPDSVASDNAALAGIVVVASIGNSDDVAEVGGSPGNARRVLAVAASDDPVDVLDGIQVTAPPGLETAANQEGALDNIFAASKSSAYDWANQPGVTDTPVAALGDWTKPPNSATDATRNNTDACAPLTPTEAALVAGKVVIMQWANSSFRCGSATRSANIAAAGAVGGIISTSAPRFEGGFLGSRTIPVMGVTSKGGTAIHDAVVAGTVVRVTMTNALRNSVQLTTPSAKDKIASFSSRGVSMAGVTKPDVAAPGVSVFSANVATGSEGQSLDGTSMASPHVAGVAALVRSKRTSWTVEEVKAAIMNTAVTDVKTDAGVAFGPLRVGAGRVQADSAVATQTLAYVTDDPGAVSVGFGPLAVTRPTSYSKTVRIVSKRPVSNAQYALSYTAATSMPGATYSLSTSGVSLQPNRPVDVKVTLTVDPRRLTHTADPTLVLEQLQGITRSFRSDTSGRVVLTPSAATGGPSLRVPVYAAPRPASVMSQPSSLTLGSGPVQRGTLPLTGSGVDQGAGTQSFVSLVSALQLQASSPRLPDCSATVVTGCVPFADDRSGDLRYVGVSSDGPTFSDVGGDPFSPDPCGDGSCAPAMVNFGISAWGPWRTAASYAEYDVYIDANGDGTDDAATYNTRISGTDTLIAETVALRSVGPYQAGDVIDQQLLNGVDGSLDTNLFNSDSVLLPVAIPALVPFGLSRTNNRIKYRVLAFTGSSGQTDTVASRSAPLSVNVASPGVGAVGDSTYPTLNTDLPGVDFALSVRKDAASAVADKPLGLLVLHHLNTDGARAQVVSVRSRGTVRVTSTATSYRYGGRPIFTATLTPATATGTVTFKDGGKVIGTVAVRNGKAAILGKGQARGVHPMTAVYNGDGNNVPVASNLVRVVVVGYPSTTSLRSTSVGYRYGARPVLTATVTPGATGTVTFRQGSRIIGTASVIRGRAVLRAPVLPRGRNYIRATYNGSERYNPSTSPWLVITVR